MNKLAMLAVLIAVMSTASPVLAWSADEVDLANTGFSPETIRVISLQKSRMEDMEPIQQERTRSQQFWWNIVHNDWLGLTYEFGQWPLKY